MSTEQTELVKQAIVEAEAILNPLAELQQKADELLQDKIEAAAKLWAGQESASNHFEFGVELAGWKYESYDQNFLVSLYKTWGDEHDYHDLITESFTLDFVLNPETQRAYVAKKTQERLAKKRVKDEANARFELAQAKNEFERKADRLAKVMGWKS